MRLETGVVRVHCFPLGSLSLTIGLMPYRDSEKQKKAVDRYYQENKIRLLKSQSLKRNQFVRRTQEIKGTTPCSDCGLKYPHYVMDFDHVRGKKRFNIASTSSIPSMRALEEEIAKCDVVCSNCHRHRTFMRASK